MAIASPLPSSTDVLVLGAGLAGLRAALACLEASPGLRVTVASLSDGPSGSSFANQNDALGIHACRTDREREDYVSEVLSLNRGAWLSGRLLAVQAEEGAARLDDLVRLGLDFARDEGGGLKAHSSCFSPRSRRAYVFTGLARAYRAFRDRLGSLGCSFVSGWMPARILGNPVEGVLFAPSGMTQLVGARGPTAVVARAVIVALGGPSRLYAHSMAGPGVPGYGQGLLSRAGAAMANHGFLQFMWGSVPGKRFWQPAETGQGGWKVFAQGEAVPLDDLVPGLSSLAPLRAGHCPFGYGLPQSALDLALAGCIGEDGAARLVRPDGMRLDVAPMAHASNGGAVIDEHGQTSVPGLLACGECATGMHGSNRLGGGMVLATQVFGRRAGQRAAALARRAGSNAGEAAVREGIELSVDTAWRERELGLLARGLQVRGVPGVGQGRREYAVALGGLARSGPDWMASLCLETARDVLAGMDGHI